MGEGSGRARPFVAIILSLLVSACATRGSLDIACADFAGALHTLQPSALRRAIQADVIPEPGPAFAGNAEAPSMAAASGAAPAEDLVFLKGLFGRPSGREELPGVPAPSANIVLSGGGQWGSFGAHFLTTLPRVAPDGDDPSIEARYLPDYQLVTGVSTGGLQTLFMAIGTQEAFTALRAAYLPAREDEIVDRNGFLQAAIKGSLAGLAPLRRRIEAALCSDAEMAAAAPRCALVQLRDTQRIPLIGFVEAASGDFRFVDVRDLIRGRSLAEARACVAGAALASAAMPVFFQQVRVDGRTYFDGGVRLSMFLERQEEARLAALRDRPGALESAPPPPGPLYIVRNGPTDVVPDVDADRKSRPPLPGALRAEQILVNQTELSSIEAMRLIYPERPIYFISADSYRRFNDGTIQDRTCKKADKDTMFDPGFMRCLADLGTTQAKAPLPWRRLPTQSEMTGSTTPRSPTR